LFLKIIPNPKDNKTLRNLIEKFYKNRTVWIIVPIKKIYNYISRAKAIKLIEPKVKGEPVIDSELNNLLVGGINNTIVIIKKEL
jgi:6-phosphogluconate dehydrogenase (decarboxylating)